MAPPRAPMVAWGGWQAERRNALTLLRTQIARARKAGRHQIADAFSFALCDIELGLRDRAAAEIAESCEMRWVHDRLPEAA